MRPEELTANKMQTQPNKADKPLRKRTVPQLAFQDAIRRLNVRREKRAVDLAFEAQLAKANQELAKLLRDVHNQIQAESDKSNNRQTRDLLTRAVDCAAKQYILQEELGTLAIVDELTGLYNRRGFLALAERQWKLARRSGRGMLLFFIDVDDLKQINDSLGHSEGDRILRRTTEALKNTFRDSDVIARLGGDEFAVLAIEASDRDEATISARFDRHLNTINAGEAESKLSLSVGVARFDHRTPESIAELMARADQAMYERKRTRRRLRTVAAQSGLPAEDLLWPGLVSHG